MIEHQTYSGTPCPFCKEGHIHVMDGASDAYGRKGVYTQCQNHLCNANGPTVYFFTPEGSEPYEYLINEAPDRIAAKAKALKLWNAAVAVDLSNLQRAWEFYQHTLKDNSSGITGASNDAEDWIKKALAELFQTSTVADDLDYFLKKRDEVICKTLGIPAKYLSDGANPAEQSVLNSAFKYPAEMHLSSKISNVNLGKLSAETVGGANVRKIHSAIVHYLKNPKSDNPTREAFAPAIQNLNIQLDVLKAKCSDELKDPQVYQMLEQIFMFKRYAQEGLVPDLDDFLKF